MAVLSWASYNSYKLMFLNFISSSSFRAVCSNISKFVFIGLISRTKSCSEREKLAKLLLSYPRYRIQFVWHFESTSKANQNLIPNLANLHGKYSVSLHVAFVGHKCSSTVILLKTVFFILKLLSEIYIYAFTERRGTIPDQIVSFLELRWFSSLIIRKLPKQKKIAYKILFP